MPAVILGDKIVLKPILAFAHEETEKVIKNHRAMNISFCGLDSSEFNHVSAYEIAKHVLDRLENTSEGTNQVQESIINLYVHQCEPLKILYG